LLYGKIVVVDIFDIAIGLKMLLMCSFMFAIVANVSAQPAPARRFATGEGKRVYDLLDGLGCIGNSKCANLGDFTPTIACDYKPFLKCNNVGLLAHLYVDACLCESFDVTVSLVFGDRSELSNQGLTGTFASNLNTFSALTWLYVVFFGL
jgi:hypothetical protein